VRPDFDPHVAIAFQVQVGMMAFVLGEPPHAVQELHRRHEILGPPIPVDAPPIGRQPPGEKSGELSSRFLSRIRRDAPFARQAFLGHELIG
jgi:hypothetical protein